MMPQKLKLLVIGFGFALVIGFLYWNLPKTFFLQDEWAGFGDILRVKESGTLGEMITHSVFPFLPEGEGVSYIPTSRILNWLIMYILYLMFGLNATPYLVLSVIFHIVNTFLVYLFVQKLSKKETVAILAAAFFGFSALHSQAITWISASFGTQGSAFFLLLGLIYFHKYLEERKRKVYYTSIGFFIVSILFKESSFFLWILFPIIDFIWEEKYTFKKIYSTLRTHIPLLFLGVLLTILKFTPLARGNNIGLFLGGQESNFLPRFLYNIVSYPLKIFPQVIFPKQNILWLAQNQTKIKFPFLKENALVQETLASEYVLVLLSLLLIGFFVILYQKTLRKKILEKKIFLFSIFFLALSVFPYIVLEQGAFFESRYYYIPMIGGSLLISFLLGMFFTFLRKKIKAPFGANFVMGVIFVLLIFPYIGLQASSVRGEIQNLLNAGEERKNIIQQIKDSYPDIAPKSIFYTESDKYYYGQAYTLFPFPAGFGSLLLTVYSDLNETNPEIGRNFFLWKMDEEGYKEIGNRGFGYFRTFDKLLLTIRENSLSSQNVYAFRWKNDTFMDITKEIRSKVDLGDNHAIIRKIVYGEKAPLHEDEPWVYFDLGSKAALTDQQLLGANKVVDVMDTLQTSELLKNEAWIGASLGYHEWGNGSSSYTLPKKVYGYEIVNIGGVRVGNENFTDIQYKKVEDGWEIKLPREIKKDEIIEWGLWVAVHQIDITLPPGGSLSEITQDKIKAKASTRIVNFTLREGTKSFEISGNPPLPKHPNTETIIFVDGEPTPVTWNRDASGKRLTITSQKTLKKGQFIEIPMIIPFE